MVRVLPRRKSIECGANDAETKFQSWRGTPEIGWEITKAMQHGEILAEIYLKQPSAVALVIVRDIFHQGSDPKAEPMVTKTAAVWAELPKAIDAADRACRHIMSTYAPGDHRAMKCLYHAENLYFSLTEAEAEALLLDQ